MSMDYISPQLELRFYLNPIIPTDPATSQSEATGEWKDRFLSMGSGDLKQPVSRLRKASASLRSR